MTRKRPASPLINELNNNNDDEIKREKRRRTMEHLKSQLQSNFTDKMIVPIASPDGLRSTRRNYRVSPVQKNQQQILMTTQSNGHSKRKVRNVFSIHKTNRELLRFVSNRTTIFKDPIDKLIKSNKNRLIDDQFQTQQNDTEINIDIDLCSDNSASNSIAGMDDNIQNNRCETVIKSDFDPNDTAIDVEDYLHLSLVQRKRSISYENLSNSNEIVAEVDLTSSTDGSIGGDDEKTDVKFIPIDIDETDHLKIQENVQHSNQISDYGTSGSGSDAISTISKTFSECASDDCVISEYCESDSLANWHNGQMVWAALPGFWPAVIFNCKNEQTFQKGMRIISFSLTFIFIRKNFNTTNIVYDKNVIVISHYSDNMIHVKFMYDNGRHSWVNKKSSLLPFKGREDLNEKCKVKSLKMKNKKKIIF